MQNKNPRAEDGLVGTRLLKGERRVVGNEHRGGAISRMGGELGEAQEPQWVVSQKTREEFQGAAGQCDKCFKASLGLVKPTIGELDGVMAKNAKLP